MKISELIKKLEDLKKKNGDLPVCIKDASEDYGFPFIELEQVEYFNKDLDEEDIAPGEEQGTEIYEFVGLSYE